MSDVFIKHDLVSLLRGRTLVLLGGSVVRGLYKDIIWLLNSNTLINRGVLGDKGEARYPDLDSERVLLNDQQKQKLKKIFHEDNRDNLHNCGLCEEDFRGLNSGRTYEECREYFHEELNIMIIFKFIIRISPTEQSRWTEQIESRLGKRRTIDILLVNSALWDINRSGPLAHLDLRQNIEDFLSNIPLSVPNALCFWLTTPPISEETNSKGMTVPGLEQQNFLTRFNVINVNKIAAEMFRDKSFQVIDLFFMMQSQIAERNKDGIHWSPKANRLMTNYTLTHMSLAMGRDLPGRIRSPALERVKNLMKKSSDTQKRKLENTIFGELEGKNVSKKFQDDVTALTVQKNWAVRNLGNFGFHREAMSARVLKDKQKKAAAILELPPLDCVMRTLRGHDELVENEGQPQNIQPFVHPHNFNVPPNEQWGHTAHMNGHIPYHVDGFNPANDGQNTYQEPFVHPQNFNVPPNEQWGHTAHMNGHIPYHVDGFNPANDGQNTYQEPQNIQPFVHPHNFNDPPNEQWGHTAHMNGQIPYHVDGFNPANDGQNTYQEPFVHPQNFNVPPNEQWGHTAHMNGQIPYHVDGFNPTNDGQNTYQEPLRQNLHNNMQNNLAQLHNLAYVMQNNGQNRHQEQEFYIDNPEHGYNDFHDDHPPFQGGYGQDFNDYSEFPHFQGYRPQFQGGRVYNGRRGVRRRTRSNQRGRRNPY